MGVLASVRRVPGPALLLWQMMTIIVDNSNNMPLLDARTLILDLFAAFDGGPSHARILSTRDLLRAGDLMDLSPTAVRTAITRLKQDGRIRAVDRGRYSQGEGDDPWRRRIDGWREVLSRRRAWDGGWLMAAARPTSVSHARPGVARCGRWRSRAFAARPPACGCVPTIWKASPAPGTGCWTMARPRRFRRPGD